MKKFHLTESTNKIVLVMNNGTNVKIPTPDDTTMYRKV